jgi:sugar phosphate permease
MYARRVGGTTNRYRWVVLATGTLAQASFGAVSVGLPALAPALRSHYRLSLSETGVVLGSVGGGMLLTALAWGFLADRVGERIVLAGGLGGVAVTLVATSHARTFPALCLSLGVCGVLGASVNVASGRAVMNWFGAHERGLALGIRQTALPIGGAGAAVSLPRLADAGGPRFAFIALGLGCFASATAAALLLRDGPMLASAAPAPTTVATGLWRDGRMWLLACGGSLYLVVQVAITNFVVLFLHQHRAVSVHAAAAVLAAINVLAIVIRVILGRWSDRRGARVAPMREIGVALAAAMAAVALLVDAPLAPLVAALVVCGALGLAWNGLAFTAAAETAGSSRSGAAFGFLLTVLGAAVAVAPPALTALVDASSWRVAFAVAAVAPVAGVLVLRRVPDPRRSPVIHNDGLAQAI